VDPGRIELPSSDCQPDVLAVERGAQEKAAMKKNLLRFNSYNIKKLDFYKQVITDLKCGS
jgi:hypothetical protein